MTSQQTNHSDSEGKTDVSFSEFILGLSSAALYYLGQTPLDGKKLKDNNLPLALQNIKIIELLKKKTHGNLENEESALIESVLRDLYQKYQEIKKLSFF